VPHGTDRVTQPPLGTVGGMGRTIEIDSPDGPAEAYLARPDDDPHPGVLLHVDAIGLRPQIEAMADLIASWGYVVLAPHAFHRSGRAADLAPTSDLTDAENWQSYMAGAMARVRALTPERSDADATRWLAALGEHATAPFGVTGYCFGARLATRTASLHPDLVAACGGWHGAGLATDDPASPHLLLAQARAAFAYGHADRDRSNPPEAVARLGEALADAGLAHTNEVYAGAPHGYTMADTSAYDEAAAERHFATLRDLLDRTLG
jgi:carboxymethylenebutenolidase